MCIIVVSYQQQAEHPLIVAANRDEFYRRRAAALAWWSDGQILAGKDLGYSGILSRLLAGMGIRKQAAAGSWLGVNREGRFAAVTNYRGAMKVPGAPAAHDGKESKDAKSRGLLIKRFLESGVPVTEFAAELDATRGEYNGFNLLFGTAQQLFYFSNRDGNIATELKPGLHVLSNAFLNTPWFKTERARSAFATLPGKPPGFAAAFELLHDGTRATTETVQQTGLPTEIELALSSIFIAVPRYGTRVSSYVTFSRSGQVNFFERTYKKGQVAGNQSFSFAL